VPFSRTKFSRKVVGIAVCGAQATSWQAGFAEQIPGSHDGVQTEASAAPAGGFPLSPQAPTRVSRDGSAPDSAGPTPADVGTANPLAQPASPQATKEQQQTQKKSESAKSGTSTNNKTSEKKNTSTLSSKNAAPTQDGASPKKGQNGSARKTTASAKPSKSKGVRPADQSDSVLKGEQPMLAPLQPQLAPVADDSKAASTKSGTTSGAAKAPPGDGSEGYPTVGKLETITFGGSTPNVTIEDRLAKLENAVLKKTFSEDSLFDRTERLKHILLGADQQEPTANMFPGVEPYLPLMEQPLDTGFQNPGDLMTQYLQQVISQPENQTEISKEQAGSYALELINELRGKIGVPPLVADPTAAKIASEHVHDLSSRGVISHSNTKGQNPDRRYTVAGGAGCVSEALVSVSRADMTLTKPTRSSIAQLIKKLISHQDDKETLFGADAGEVGLAFEWTADKQKLFGCVEVVTAHGTVNPIPTDVKVGEKIEVSGTIEQPYHFERVTVAWEGSHSLDSSTDESEEALPYFPPLDYAAFQQKSEHDYSTALTALRIAGVAAALAGGVFMPPVALAAPMIAMSGGFGGGRDPKPASDIPVHGGVHTDGTAFSAKVPINNGGKEGIYYITVWASLGKGTKMIPVSRRAVVAEGSSESVKAKIDQDEPGHKHEK